MGKILNLNIKTVNDYFFTVICTESLYQLLYLRFICYKLKLIDDVIRISRRYLYHMIKTISYVLQLSWNSRN